MRASDAFPLSSRNLRGSLHVSAPPLAYDRNLFRCLRLEELRPFECFLTSKDYTLLEAHLVKSAGDIDPFLERLVRVKLADARIVLSTDVDDDVATGNSRIVFSVNGREGKSVLVHWEHPGLAGPSLPVLTPLGATLLGMRVGQRATLLDDDGRIGHVVLKRVEFQPEAARRAAGHQDAWEVATIENPKDQAKSATPSVEPEAAKQGDGTVVRFRAPVPGNRRKPRPGRTPDDFDPGPSAA